MFGLQSNSMIRDYYPRADDINVVDGSFRQNRVDIKGMALILKHHSKSFWASYKYCQFVSIDYLSRQYINILRLSLLELYI